MENEAQGSAAASAASAALSAAGLSGSVTMLPGLFASDAEELARCKGEGGELIKNSNHRRDATRREMTAFAPASRGRLFARVMYRLRGDARVSERVGCLQVEHGVVIESWPGGRAQSLHRDLTSEEFASVLSESGGARPMSLLITLSPGGVLLFLNPSDPDEILEIGLDAPGDAVLFDADVVHGGGAYGAFHRRCHFHLVPPGAAGRGTGKVLEVVCRATESFRRVRAGDRADADAGKGA